MVHIVGAGPGDPELITVKGHRLLSEADVVIYAGSLVNEELLKCCKPEAEIYNSAQMMLEEIIHVIVLAEKAGKTTVRLHTGDPSIYGATQEQMDALEARGIEFDVTPGVSSFLAAAASLKQEYTLPGVTQTVIITRRGGRTPVPDTESLKKLAQHQTTICIFLSVSLLGEIKRDLMSAGFKSSTPIAVVYKASWPGEEKIIRGRLDSIVDQVKEANIDRTALIVIGHCLDSKKEGFQPSKLYSPKFGHMFRQARF
ncbi:MAG: precorrin-4 C(11)-methyltransferase [Selenomonadaceae bacterium]|nr:precorrin-4 C(11)-methyltransferase [Selenomonadaceae bacterium]